MSLNFTTSLLFNRRRRKNVKTKLTWNLWICDEEEETEAETERGLKTFV
jgi:hypothetical protein